MVQAPGRGPGDVRFESDRSPQIVAPGGGFEPPFSDSKTDVLPLHHPGFGCLVYPRSESNRHWPGFDAGASSVGLRGKAWFSTTSLFRLAYPGSRRGGSRTLIPAGLSRSALPLAYPPSGPWGGSRTPDSVKLSGFTDRRDLPTVATHGEETINIVGATGFEPAASWSQTRRSAQTELHPKKGSRGRGSRTHRLLRPKQAAHQRTLAPIGTAPGIRTPIPMVRNHVLYPLS